MLYIFFFCVYFCDIIINYLFYFILCGNYNNNFFFRELYVFNNDLFLLLDFCDEYILFYK